MTSSPAADRAPAAPASVSPVSVPFLWGAVARPAEEGFTPLFDGRTTANWQTAGAGGFVVVDGRLESVPGDAPGLYWCTIPLPPDFVLRLKWLRWRHEDTSSVVLRFPHPGADGDANPALLACERGFEVRIDEVGTPGESGVYRTGTVFDQPSQEWTPRPARGATEWNEFEIAAEGERYTVRLNGARVSTFVNANPARGRASGPGAPSFMGLRVCPGGRVAFRNIRIRPL